jgi:hypothetical protein
MADERSKEDFGELPELYPLRQEWAIRLAEVLARHNAETAALYDRFRNELTRRGIDDRQAGRELLAMIRDATPIVDEDVGGL